MTDFGKVNPEQAQKIIGALKDGKINEKEMKELGLTKAEAEELNKAFSSGEVQIGDFVLVNKGKSKDGKKQYSSTKKAEPQEEAGLIQKGWNKLKRDFKGYGENFTKAWNNSEGFLGTAGALIGATTKTATDAVKNYAENVEKGVAEATGSEAAGKVARYMAGGVGFVADAAEAVEQFGDWGADKIRAKAKEYTGSERQLLESFADFVDDMNAADIALMFAGGAGAAKFVKEMPKIMKLLGIGAGTMQKVGIGVGAAAMTACSDMGKTEINQNVNLTIKQDSSLEEALDALLQGQSVQTSVLQAILQREIKNGMTSEEILKLVDGNKTLLNNIIEALTMGNQLLAGIRKDVNDGNEKILNAIIEVQNSVEVITTLIANLPADIKNELSPDLTKIQEGIQRGNINLETMVYMVKNLAGKLYEISDRIEVNGKTQEEIKALLDKMQAGENNTQVLLDMLDLLKSIDFTTKDINNKLDKIINDFEKAFANNAEIKASLKRIEEYLKKNNDKTDVTNNLLEQLLKKYQAGGISEGDIQKIIDAISKNGEKIDITNKLLTNMQKQNAQFQNAVLKAIAMLGINITGQLNNVINAINKLGAKGDGIKDLLNKILVQLDKMNANQRADAQKIIEALGKIQVGNGGTVDLTSVEKMLAELIKLVGENGKQLSDMNVKMDVLNVTSQAILDKLGNEFGKNDERYISIMNALNVIKNKGFDDSKLLAKLDKMTGKLDDILAAIKDHKVTVDVSGKVTCECNCGGNHEGILGELENILS